MLSAGSATGPVHRTQHVTSNCDSTLLFLCVCADGTRASLDLKLSHHSVTGGAEEVNSQSVACMPASVHSCLCACEHLCMRADGFQLCSSCVPAAASGSETKNGRNVKDEM